MADLTAGIAKANALIADMCERDGVDTRLHGLMVRKAGQKSVALHGGLHPSEIAVGPHDGKDDPRRPRARVGLTAGGNPDAALRRDIESRHAKLVHLHKWDQALKGRRPRAADMRWDPILLSLLRLHGADLDAIAASGPTDFVNSPNRSNHPIARLVVEAPDDDGTRYSAIVDGDEVRAEYIRYAPGVFYLWSRGRPDEVRLEVADFAAPKTISYALIGHPFSRLVGHPSLSEATATSVSAIGRSITVRGGGALAPCTGTN